MLKKQIPVIMLACLLVPVMSCKTTTISVNKEEMKKIQALAVMKFECEPGIDPKIAVEAEESFRGHFLNIGKKVVEREKLNSILKEIEKSQAGVVDESVQIGRLSGAQALLFGKITQNKEERKLVTYSEYDRKLKKSFQKQKIKKFFTFQLHIRLVSTVTGDTIMTMKNKYPESDYEITDSTTLARFRERVIQGMGDDLKSEMKD